ncbi:MAG: ferritin-like domain-containing protein [Bacteroidota bacterium]
MQIDSLKKLFVDTLQDIYSAERQITEAIPKMMNAAKSKELKNAFKEHLEVTRIQVERLKEIFDNMNQSPGNKVCTAMKEIIHEGEEMISEITDNEVLDAALIASAQKIEHYEISGYGTARTYADILGNDDARDLLQTTLDEEKETDKKLTELAVNTINVEAKEKHR